MALYTREHAKESARVAKDHQEYTVAVGVSEDFTTLEVRNYPERAQVIWQTLEATKSKYGERTILITEKLIKEKFPYATTIKDLEVIFYQLVNGKIQSLQRAKQQIGEQHERFNPVIYASDVGYNSRRMRFYVKVRETDKSIWLQQVGKRMIGGDPQNPLVTVNTTEKSGEVFSRRKKEDSTTIKIGNYEYARLWNGEPIQEFSD